MKFVFVFLDVVNLSLISAPALSTDETI